MKIIKFAQYITENVVNDSPEDIIKQVLMSVKRKVEKMFDSGENKDEIITYGENVDKERKAKGGMGLSELGLNLESSELTRYSKLNDSVKFIFSDEDHRYDLIVIVDLKSAIPEEEDQLMNMDDIDECTIKFKKYTDNELIGQFNKTVKVKDIDEELLIDLKIELDEMAGDDTDSEDDLELDFE